MSRKFTEDMLTAYALGELDEEGRRVVEEALEREPRYQEELRKIRQTIGYLAEKLSESPSARLDPARKDQLRTEFHKAAAKRKKRPAILRPYVLGPAAAAALVLIVVMESGVPPAKDVPTFSEPPQAEPEAPQKDGYGSATPIPKSNGPAAPDDDDLQAEMPAAAPSALKQPQQYRAADAGPYPKPERKPERARRERLLEAKPNYRLRDVVPGKKTTAPDAAGALKSAPPSPASPEPSAAPERGLRSGGAGVAAVDPAEEGALHYIELTVPFELLSKEKQAELRPKLDEEATKNGSLPFQIRIGARKVDEKCEITLTDARTRTQLASSMEPCSSLSKGILDLLRTGIPK